MDIFQMKNFIVTAKYLNFTEAATQLYISQPTLSRQIASIEAELNMQLFIRDNRSVQLTLAGKYLYDQLTVLYASYCDIIKKAGEINVGLSSTLNVGILDGHIMDSTISNVLVNCFDKYPSMKINLSRGSFHTLTDKLYDGSLDLALTLYFDIADKEKIEFTKVCETIDCIAIHADHEKSNMEKAVFKNFKEDTFILLSPEDSATSAAHILDLCKKQGFIPKVLYAKDLETLMLWVESGIGIALINTNNALENNPNVKLIPCMQSHDTDIVIAWHQNNQSISRKLFLEELKNIENKSIQ